MIFWLALLICSTGIAGLFFLDRDPSTRNSKALWLPVIWLWIAGSRAVSSWFGIRSGSAGALASTLDGSPIDAAIYAILMAAGIIVLFLRRDRAVVLLKKNGPILIYLLYCLISITWSSIPEPAFKRWTKDVGDVVMALVLVTDGHPIEALRRLYSRVGFILLPFSIFLIRYTDLGRAFTPDGEPMNTGVTTNKNALGLIVYLVLLGAVWNVRALLRDKEIPNRNRRLIAQGSLLTFGLVLLQMAHCATAVACFVLGGGLMLTTSLRAIRNRPARVHALCLAILLGGALTMSLGGQSIVTSALGRKENMGRADIWKAAIAAAGNPVIGTGFESFWNTSVHKVARGLPGYWDMNDLATAHDGYIEVYLNLGWVGVCLIAVILISGYRRAGEVFRRDPEFGSLILAYVVTAAFYSITESGFRVLTPSWIFLLLAVVSASGFVSGLFGNEAREILDWRGGTASKTVASNRLVPAGAVYTARRGPTKFGITRANNPH
jgi:exopolysaccharide production protein ExoQ